MSVTATFLGHAAVHIGSGEHSILIDPFLTGNPCASVTPEEIQADMVLLTHDHEDHLGDTEHFLKEGATFVGIHELATRFGEQGYTAEGMNIGGRNWPVRSPWAALACRRTPPGRAASC